MTAIPTAWGTYSITINISPALVGHILQFGFANTGSNYVASGVYYDNISFQRDLGTSTKATTWGSVKKLYR